MAQPDTILDDIAQDLLAVAVAALDDPPARQYVAAGSFDQVAEDCNQCTVTWDRLRSSGTPGPTASGAGPHRLPWGVVPVADFTIQVVRCVTAVPSKSGAAPSVAAMEAEALRQHTDAWQLWAAVNAALRGDTLLAKCQAVTYQPVVPIGPRGLLFGVRWTLEIQVG